MKFYKFHGTGNDFIMVDNRQKTLSLSPKEVRKWCHRHFGIGADGLILVETSENADFFMNYYNADGSLAEMCGNGTRCTAHFVKDILGFSGDAVLLETRAGRKQIDCLENNHFRVNMGMPYFEKFSDFPRESQVFEGVRFSFVSMGNPHAIGFFENEEQATTFLNNAAPDMEKNTNLFPHRINVSVSWKKGEDHFGAKTHERGCGQTLACGTAMSGLFALLVEKWKYSPKNKRVQIDVPGGTLFFEYNNNKEILMTGPSEKVFEGEL